MGFFFNIGFGGNQREPLNIDTDNSGNIFYTMFSSSSAIGKAIPDNDKLMVILNNPALLKVIALDCDIFSLGKINQYENNKLKEADFLYSESENDFQICCILQCGIIFFCKLTLSFIKVLPYNYNLLSEEKKKY